MIRFASYNPTEDRENCNHFIFKFTDVKEKPHNRRPSLQAKANQQPGV